MQQQLSHIDLFSGIGGFSLASAWAGFETVVFCEKDKYCHKILNKHWPSVPIIEDIHEFKGEQYSGTTLLTAGVPCQPASVAGRQRGTEDDRWLWPETLRVISESNPKWVILENVRGLVSLNGGMEFDNLLTELEALQYETRAFIIPACGVGAPHRRERVWIVANAINSSDRAKRGAARETNRIQGVNQPTVCTGMPCGTSETEASITMADTDSKGLAQRRQDSVVQPGQGRLGCSVSSSGQFEREPNTYVADTKKFSCHDKQLNTRISSQTESSDRELGDKSRATNVADTNITGSQGHWQPRECSCKLPFGTARPKTVPRPNWEFEPNVGKLANGIPDRVAKLRALGNAIVPQVAYQIIEKIAMIELGMSTTEDS